MLTRRVGCTLRKSIGASSGFPFTFQIGFCGFPPIVQRTHNGWGTQSFVNTRIENAPGHWNAFHALNQVLTCPAIKSNGQHQKGLMLFEPRRLHSMERPASMNGSDEPEKFIVSKRNS